MSGIVRAGAKARKGSSPTQVANYCCRENAGCGSRARETRLVASKPMRKGRMRTLPRLANGLHSKGTGTDEASASVPAAGTNNNPKALDPWNKEAEIDENESSNCPRPDPAQ